MVDELIPDPFAITLAAAIGGASSGDSTTITLTDTSWITGALSFATGDGIFWGYIGNPALPASMEVVRVTQTSPSIIVTRGADGRTPVSHDTSHLFGPALRGTGIQNLIDQALSATTPGHVIQNFGTPLTQRANLNFIGDLVAATDNSGDDATDVTVFPPSMGDITDLNESERVLKSSVRVATTGALTLATGVENGDTIDGVTLATNDRVLIKDQASGAENGIYRVNASGAPTRTSDANTAAELPYGFLVAVKSGTANANTLWQHTTTAAITLNTTALTFARVGAPSDHNHTGSTDGGVLTNDQHDGYSDHALLAAPATPATGKGRLWFDSTDYNYMQKDDVGVVHRLGRHAINAPEHDANVVAYTSNATIADGTRFATVDATGGNRTLTLPAASFGDAYLLTIKRLDGSVNTVTIQRAGSDTIDGATSITLDDQYDSVTLRSEFSGRWDIEARVAAAAPVGAHTHTGDTLTPASVEIAQRLRLTFYDAAQLTADVNNYDPGSGSGLDLSAYNVWSDATRTITGLEVDQTSGDVVYLVNNGSFDVVLAHEDAGSSAANRFAFAGAADITLLPNDLAVLIYDSATGRWHGGKVVESNGGGGGGTMSSFTLAGDTGTQTINDGNTLTVAGGVGLVSAAAATDTVTVNLDVDSLTEDTAPSAANDFVATYDASASGHKKVKLERLGFYNAYVCIRDEKANNTAGGTFTAGAFRTRDLNTEKADTAGVVSVSGNQIVFAAGAVGTWLMRYRCPAYQVDGHTAYLYDITNSAVVSGSESSAANENSAVAILGYAQGEVRVALAGATTFEVRHRCQTTKATFGFGVQSNNFAGGTGVEVYTVFEAWREA